MHNRENSSLLIKNRYVKVSNENFSSLMKEDLVNVDTNALRNVERNKAACSASEHFMQIASLCDLSRTYVTYVRATMCVGPRRIADR